MESEAVVWCGGDSWLRCVYLQVSDDRRVVVDGFAVHGLPHAFPVEGELLHRLLLGEVWPLVKDLPRRLVLEARHVEEPLRRADVRRHGDTAIPAGQEASWLVSARRSLPASTPQNWLIIYIQQKNPIKPDQSVKFLLWRRHKRWAKTIARNKEEKLEAVKQEVKNEICIISEQHFLSHITQNQTLYSL